MVNSLAFVLAVAVAVLPGESDYAKGRRAENLTRYGDAYAAYQAVAAQGGALQGYALVRAAVCRTMGGDMGGGLAELEGAVASSPREPWTVLAQYELGILLARENQLELAAPNLLPIFANRSRLWWLETHRWRAADYLIEAPGHSAAAFDFFRGVVGSTIYRVMRRDAAIRLDRSESVDDRLDAVAGFLRSRDHREAARVLRGIAKGDLEDPAASERVALLSGRLLIAQGRQSAGRKVLAELVQASPASPFAPSALLAMARSSLRAFSPARHGAFLPSRWTN